MAELDHILTWDGWATTLAVAACDLAGHTASPLNNERRPLWK